MVSRAQLFLLLSMGATAGCLFLPHGFEEQQRRSRIAAERYLQPLLERPLPPLEGEADLNTLVRYAWQTNGTVRAALLEWVAAVERVREQAGYPNTNLHLALEGMLGNGGFGWNDLTWRVANDPMTNLALPFKVSGAARIALEEARKAEASLHAQRLALWQQLAQRFFAWVSASQRAALAQQRVQWLERLQGSARAAMASGIESQAEWLEVVNARTQAMNESLNLLAEAEAARRQLNALLGRHPEAELRPPAVVQISDPWSPQVQELLTRVRSANPELAALRSEVAARERALDLARLQFLPDINPMAAFTGNVSQVLGAGIVLPLTWRKLQAQVAVAKHLLAASQELLQQAEHDRLGEVATTIVVLQNIDRQRQLWAETLLPNWRRRCRTLRRAYESGSQPLTAWVQAETTLLEAEAVLTELAAMREEQLVRLAALLGQDDEWLYTAKGGWEHAAQ